MVSTMVTEKFLILNTCSGSIGSAARRSVTRNQASPATASAISAMTCHEPHWYWVPPQVASRMTAVETTPSRMPPR